MKQRMSLQERLGRAFAAHAMRVAAPENAEWIRAMVHEQEIFGSSALIGPLGMVATFWTLSSSLHRLGKTLMVVLWLLAAWAFAIYIALLALLQSAHMLGGLLAVWVMLFASFVVLPAFAVAQLQWLDTRRPPASAGS